MRLAMPLAVADGRCDVVMAGGAEAPFTPGGRGFGNMTAPSNSGETVRHEP